MQEAVSPVKNSRGKWQLALVFLIPALGMGMAWLMYFTGLWIPEGRTNKGELILPPYQFTDLKLFNGSKPFDLEELDGKWSIVVFGSNSCAETNCRESLYKTRQVHIALGKETDRVVRLYVAQQSSGLSAKLENEHPDVFWLNTSEETLRQAMKHDRWPENQFFIMDPFGNIMMMYRPDQAGGDLLKDLKKLLKASSIG